MAFCFGRLCCLTCKRGSKTPAQQKSCLTHNGRISHHFMQVQQTQQMRRHKARKTRSLQKSTLCASSNNILSQSYCLKGNYWILSSGRCPCPWEGSWNKVIFKVLCDPNRSVKAIHQNIHFSSLLQALFHSLFQEWTWKSKDMAATPCFRAFHILCWLEQLVNALAQSLAVG